MHTITTITGETPEWGAVLAAAAGCRCWYRMRVLVLVGDTAAAYHARHRVSFDDDHVVAELRTRFDEVLAALEETDGWVTARVKRPVLILGRLNGVETGSATSSAARPIEVEEIALGDRTVRVPTLVEITRIKA